jgi:predicted site-specific integrase-resolvase
MDKNEWITAKEAARITGRHYETIRNWAKEGLIEAKRITDKGSSPLMVRKASIPSFMIIIKN